METKAKAKQNPSGKRFTAKPSTESQINVIPGMTGVRLVRKPKFSVLELRDRLGVTQEFFSRLVDVSVRTIAALETNPKPVKKLYRNYAEVERLCDALDEVVTTANIASWLQTPNEGLNGFKPVEIIERGEIDRLWEMVFRLRSGMPS